MSCSYPEELLEIWDGVCNPIGDFCYNCDDCFCKHWSGDHSDFCPNGNPDCYADAGGYDRYYNLRE